MFSCLRLPCSSSVQRPGKLDGGQDQVTDDESHLRPITSSLPGGSDSRDWLARWRFSPRWCWSTTRATLPVVIICLTMHGKKASCSKRRCCLLGEGLKGDVQASTGLQQQGQLFVEVLAICRYPPCTGAVARGSAPGGDVELDRHGWSGDQAGVMDQQPGQTAATAIAQVPPFTHALPLTPSGGRGLG